VTAAEATSSAFITASGSLAARITSNEARTGSYATTGSNQFNGSQTVTGSLTATGTIVAQTLVVQTITSSVDFVTGSAKFGSTTDNNHQFTGSILVSGSVGIGTSPTTKLDVYAATAGSTANILRLKNASNDTSTGLRMKWDFQSIEGAYLDVTTNSGGSKSMTLYLSAENATPAEVLTIAGSNKAATFAGNVGIGSTPSYTLDVRGDVNGDVVLARLQNRDGNLSTGAYIGFSTGYAAMATIGAKREGAENDSSLVFSPMLNENAVERMRITSGGNVGIGTTTPAKKLDVYDSNGNATAQIKLRNAGSTPAAYLGAFSGNLYLSAGGTYDSGWTTDGSNGVANIVMETSNGGSAIAFGTAASNNAPTERMRITSGGNVLIGNGSSNTASNLLSIATTSADQGIILLTQSNGATNSRWGIVNPGVNNTAYIGTFVNNAFALYSNSVERIRIETDGKVGIGTTTPYSRLDINGGNIRMGEILNNASSYIGKQYSANSNFYSSVQFLSTTGQDMIVFNTHESGQSSGERMRITGDGVLQFSTIGTVPTYNNSIYSYSSNGYMYIQGGTTGLGLTGSGNRSNAIYINSTNNAILFQTNNAGTRMQIMSSGAVGTGQSANGTSLRATLVKQGTTSITFTATLNTIGAWRPGHAMIRVSGAQNGLQEYWAAWFFVRLIGYVGSGVATSVLDSGGETGNISFSSSSDTNSPQTINFILTDSGATTNTMIADIDFVYNEGIVSLT
jgi:hypothetical protein